MQIIKVKPELRPHIGKRREINLKETPLQKAEALQISELRPDRKEEYHTNNVGYVLCFVVSGWMEAYCQGKNYKLKEGEGIVFEPGERHRINKGKGLMFSISSLDYADLKTAWEK